MDKPRSIPVPAEAAGQRIDRFLVAQLAQVSRARVQLLLEQGGVLVDGARPKASQKLRGGERIVVTGDPRPALLKATPEDIPLRVIYEDDDLAVIDKPAGMMVHAGSGATDDVRNRGTLVNALLYRFQSLSSTGGELRPGIVHRLDKDTSGLILVAKNDRAHAALARMFSSRQIRKTYIALVHGSIGSAQGTISAAIGRDPLRRTRMSTKVRENTRSAVSHYRVLRRLDTRFGKFTLIEVRIETDRTHQIRVHMASIGHPVAGDKLYGAAGRLTEQPTVSSRAARRPPLKTAAQELVLGRNFLHAAELEFSHPLTGKLLHLASALPVELIAFLQVLEGDEIPAPASKRGGNFAIGKIES